MVFYIIQMYYLKILSHARYCVQGEVKMNVGKVDDVCR